MHIFILPLKDTTLYNDKINQNTGKDEILEIIKRPITILSSSYDNSSRYVSTYVSSSILSRILLQFNLSDVSQLINSGIITAPKFYLNMHVCRVEGQEEFSTLYLYPVTETWVQGIGKRLDNVIRTTGASWKYRDGETLTAWINAGGDFNGAVAITASMWPNENRFQESETYTYELADLRVDVSEIVYSWLSGSYDNNGFIIKRSDEEENNAKDYGIIQFYSSDTNTVFPPTLEVAWDDSEFNIGTGSTALIPSNINDMFIYTKNLKSTYNSREKVKIQIGTREMFPSRSYADINQYNQNKYLPETSYYSIIDAYTTETIIPFDTSSSKISCDVNGNFFNLWMSSFQPERFYRIRIKVVSGSIQNIFDIPTNFKVVRV